MERVVSRMSFPCPIVFGPGAIEELPRELQRLGASRPLVVADAGVTAAGLTRKVLDALKARDIDDVLVVIGGIVTTEARTELEELGITSIFGPGSSLNEIIGNIEEGVPRLRAV